MLIKELLELSEAKKMPKDEFADTYGNHPKHGQDYYVTFKVSKDFDDDQEDELNDLLNRHNFRLKGWGGGELEIKDDDGVTPDGIRSVLDDLRKIFKDRTFMIKGHGVNKHLIKRNDLSEANDTTGSASGDKVIFRTERDVINHLVDEFDHEFPYGAIQAYFIGGDHAKVRKFHDAIVADGYDDAGAWSENKKWFKKHGITKKAFDMLVKASL